MNFNFSNKNNLILVALSVVSLYIVLIFDEIFCVRFKDFELVSSTINGVTIIHDSRIPVSYLREALYLAQYNFEGITIEKSLTKYFSQIEGNFYRYRKTSPYDHPNLYLGEFKGIYLNLPHSHNYLSDFEEISKNDCSGRLRTQFVSTILYAYDNSHNLQLVLNNPKLNLTDYQIIQKNLPKHEADFYEGNMQNYQNYLKFNNNRFDEIIKKTLKLPKK